MKYNVVLERDENGRYIASILELPGCHTQAKNIDKVMARIKEAAELYLESTNVEPSKNEFIGIQVLEITQRNIESYPQKNS